MAHDASPRWLRDIMNYSVANWSCEVLLREATSLSRSIGSDRAADVMRRQIAGSEPQETYRVYGPDHPGADAKGQRLRPAANAAWSPSRRKGRRA